MEHGKLLVLIRPVELVIFLVRRAPFIAANPLPRRAKADDGEWIEAGEISPVRGYADRQFRHS